MLAARGVAARQLSKTAAAVSARSFSGLVPVTDYHEDEPRHPNDTMENLKPPTYWAEQKPYEIDEKYSYHRNPVTSASAIDVISKPAKISEADTVTLKDGKVAHGRYGTLDAKGVPLEYLTMLHPAAEAAAALRTLGNSGTVLVYGASTAAGLAATQLAKGTVVAVIDGEHGHSSDMVTSVKDMAKYPGTAVAENYAMLKKNFADLVHDTVHGTDGASSYDTDADFLADFKANVVDYCQAYPSGQSAVDPSSYEFIGKEMDRKHFKDNMEVYLEQFSDGAPPIAQSELDSLWTKEHYAAFKTKFLTQTTALISNDEKTMDAHFEPASIIKSMMGGPASLDDYTSKQTTADGSAYVPYEFNVLDQAGDKMPSPGQAGGPISGAIIVANPALVKATEAVSKAKTMRAKAEALMYLTAPERATFSAATNVARLAQEAGKPVLVIGGYGLPNYGGVKVEKEDVTTAVKAMEIQPDGSSTLNFFLQVYRAGDFPIYEHHAIHRATEILSGPRQIVVTK